MPITFKDIVAKAVRSAIMRIQWERDPFAVVENSFVKEKPLETIITIRMRHISYRFMVQVRQLK